MTVKKSVLLFIAFLLISILVQLPLFQQLIRDSLKNEYSSHILLIPLVSVFLLFRSRSVIFADSRTSFLGGAVVSLLAIILLVFAPWILGPSTESDLLSLKTMAVVFLWIGGFLFFFGAESFRKALFPLLFLLLMVPIPEAWVRQIVTFLQRGSAEAVDILFQLTGTPYSRTDMVFMLPGVNIEIAPQCSGIRSSLALFITTLLAGHLMLETGWRKLLLALISIPMAFVKNAVRIVALSLLAIHVDMSYLTGSDLHRRGGILFFLIALLLMAPILWGLHKTERKRGPTDER